MACIWSDDSVHLDVKAVVSVTMRLPDDALYQALLTRESEWQAAGIAQVSCIGDALAPGLIAHAVYAGHRFAREFEAAPVKMVIAAKCRSSGCVIVF